MLKADSFKIDWIIFRPKKLFPLEESVALDCFSGDYNMLINTQTPPWPDYL